MKSLRAYGIYMDAFIVNRRYMMSADFCIPTSCALGEATEFLIDKKIDTADSFDGDKVNVEQHEIIEVLIYRGSNRYRQSCSQSYIWKNDSWISVDLRPEFLTRNKHIFCPLPETPHST